MYVEQQEGAQLAIFDVTDHSHVRVEGSVQLDAPGPFDCVANLGKRGELVTRNSIALMTDDDSRFTGQPINPHPSQGVRDCKIFLSGDSPSDRVLEILQVHEGVTNADTGTTFLLAASGLYPIRRPALEATPFEVNGN